MKHWGILHHKETTVVLLSILFFSNTHVRAGEQDRGFYDIAAQFVGPSASLEADQSVSLTTTDTSLGTEIAEQAEVRRHRTPWLFMIYMAADNDLKSFAVRNLKQMAQIGSNDRVTIVVQLDIRLKNNKKITQRYLITRGNYTLMNENDPTSQAMDSGKAETLISFCSWAIKNYPAEQHALVFWNHGSGIIDPNVNRVVCASELFRYNPAINRLELDRSIGFLDFMNTLNIEEPCQRGICWDDSTGNYLTNQKLDDALNTICSKLLGQKKFGLIVFDACLMAMLEVANIVKSYAHVMSASEEVELGTGIDYAQALAPFISHVPTAHELGAHIANTYAVSYQKITNDYTHSTIDLDRITALEHNVHKVSQHLINCLRNQKNSSVKQAILNARTKNACTHFEEPSYIDLHHFYRNILNTMNSFVLKPGIDQGALLMELRQALQEGLSIVEDVVIANVAGKNLSNARGVSIYFPERGVHPSYRKTFFAQTNDWSLFLNQFLLL